MAVILEERGRGKFKPAPDYKDDEVKELMNKKIEEERQAEQGVSRRNQCDYYLANLFGEQAFRFFISV